MIIVWRGLGILAPVLGFGSLVVANVVTDSIFGDGYYTANPLPKVCGGLLAFAILFPLGRYLHRDKTNPRRHTFFFLRIEDCGIGLLAVTIAMAAVQFFR